MTNELKVGIVVVAGLVGLSCLSFLSYRFFAPRYAAVDNAVFHESAQYNDGMIRDLESLQIQYQSANDDQKAALKAVILHRFSIYPESKMPENLKAFYRNLKGTM